MKKSVRRVKKQLTKKVVSKRNKIYWVSVTSFIFAVLGWMSFGLENSLFNFYAFIILCIAPILGVFGLVRLHTEKDSQIRRLNTTLSWIAIIISVLFLSCILIGLLF